MRASLLVALGLLVAAALAAKQDAKWRDPCDPAIIEKAAKAADKRIAGVEAKYTHELSIIKSTIDDWMQRLVDKDPECEPERLNCAAMLKLEQKSFKNVEARMRHEVDELKEAKEAEAKQLHDRCLRSQTGGADAPASFIEVKCQGGKCTCGSGKRLTQSDKPIEANGCSVPSFLDAQSFNSPLYDAYLARWHTSACDKHDRCYATCGSVLSKCESEFRLQLERDCTRLAKTDEAFKAALPRTLCPWLCEHEEAAAKFFGEAPTDPAGKHVCRPYVDRTECEGFAEKELERYALEDCKRIAGLFSIGAQMFGGSAFVDSQRSHCECVDDREL